MEHVLVVEDEEILRNLMVDTLHASGYTVTAAGDGNAAWEKLEAGGIQVVLSDLLMPHLNGYDLLRKIRADARFAELPCLVLSNSGQMDDLNRAYECGADGVLIKADFNPSQLVEKMREVIARRADKERA